MGSKVFLASTQPDIGSFVHYPALQLSFSEIDMHFQELKPGQILGAFCYFISGQSTCQKTELLQEERGTRRPWNVWKGKSPAKKILEGLCNAP